MNYPWLGGNTYEKFMGRWSSLVAGNFLKWFDRPHGLNWLDVGCGTGSLTELILETQNPTKILAVDSSEEFISHAKKKLNNPLVQFITGQAESLTMDSHSVDAVVSGLVLNFIPKPEDAIREMMRVTKPSGAIGIFLWDYSDGMQMLRYFWDAAVELDPRAMEFDEGIKFPVCKQGQLELLMSKAGFRDVEAGIIEISTNFKNFNDYWQPFFCYVGPAPSYVMSLDKVKRQQLEMKIRNSLPINKDGSISITARAWAAKGIV